MNKQCCVFVFLLFLLGGCSKDFNSDVKNVLPEYETPDRTKVPSFPGAEGGGMYTLGCSGGNVYIVNSLEDNLNHGTLRWALDKIGVRTIVFAVSGNIKLNSLVSDKLNFGK